MISPVAASWRVVLYEGEGSHPLGADERFEATSALLERGYAVSNVRPGGRLPNLGHADLLVLGRFVGEKPPHVEDALGEVRLHFHQLDEGIIEAGAASVLALVEAEQNEQNVTPPGGWKPWFPVIDFDRCTNCMQCLSFCLFDVYGVSGDGKIQVQNQTNCKTDCPACSRVCPDVAILFPKYKAGPINGAEINSDDLRREAMKVDISSLLGGDIYALLRDRSEKAKSRFSKERDDERALKERMRCLKKLQEGLGDLEIPAEVISSLPSMDEIQAKAAEAKRKAEKALQQQEQSKHDV